MYIGDGIIIVIGFLPVCCGMVKAFFSGKKVGKIGYETSAGVWDGYEKGVNFSIYVFSLEMLLFILLALSEGVESFGMAFAASLFAILVYTFFTSLVGLFLYTASSFFGYGIGKQSYVSALIEIEASKTHEQIATEIKTKQQSRLHLD